MNKMKIMCVCMMSLLGTVMLSAQPGEMDEKRREKIEVLKRAYISEKLELTVTEAEKFWPIYNEYDQKKDGIRKTIHTSHEKLKTGEQSEKDAIGTIDMITQKRKEEVDLDGKFLKDCLPVLGVKKVMRLATLEKEFQKQLMQTLKERRQEKGQGAHGDGPARKKD